MAHILSDIGVLSLIIMLITVFMGAILRAFTGFGFAIAALPVLSHLFSPSTNVFLMAALTLTVSLLTIRTYWHHTVLSSLMVMILLSAIGTATGLYILLLVPVDIFRIAIGITVMASCLLLLRYKPTKHRSHGGTKSAIAGFFSGLMNGAIAIPGPPVIIYALAVFPEPVKSRAFLMVFFIFSAVFVIGGVAYEGLIRDQELTIYLLALPAMVLGDKAGFWLFDKYGNAAYRKVAIGALFVIGAISLTATII